MEIIFGPLAALTRLTQIVQAGVAIVDKMSIMATTIINSVKVDSSWLIRWAIDWLTAWFDSIFATFEHSAPFNLILF
ncbi:MAG: hypothetical protein WCG35_03090 [Betaproteobacteria bacterium]